MIYMTYRLELGPVVVVGEMSPSFVVSKDQMLEMTSFSLDELVINISSDIRITDFLRHEIFKRFESRFGISISISDGHGFWIHAEGSSNSTI
jgi:hypothetical protein